MEDGISITIRPTAKAGTVQRDDDAFQICGCSGMVWEDTAPEPFYIINASNFSTAPPPLKLLKPFTEPTLRHAVVPATASNSLP